VQAVGTIAAREGTSAGLRLSVRSAWEHRPSLGDSVCVSGCCLTVAAVSTGGGELTLGFDVVPESLARTTLGGLAAGSMVNLEPSCTPQSLLGGHIVQGHVEGMGRIEAIDMSRGWLVWIGAPGELMPCVTPKGSIAVDGVSLTVASVEPAGSRFAVALIPTTLAATALGRARVGDPCNLETDILARTVVHYARCYAGVPAIADR
jgi:riboflavin synthase